MYFSSLLQQVIFFYQYLMTILISYQYNLLQYNLHLLHQVDLSLQLKNDHLLIYEDVLMRL